MSRTKSQRYWEEISAEQRAEFSLQMRADKEKAAQRTIAVMREAMSDAEVIWAEEARLGLLC